MLDGGWRPTPDQVIRYTEGDCWLLAFELAVLLRAPLTALAAADDPADWLHVAVDLGRERLLDVTGAHDRENLRATWQERLREPLTFRELGFFHCFDDYLTELDGHSLGRFISRRDEDDARATARAIAHAFSTEDADEDGTAHHDHAHAHDHLLCGAGRIR